MKKIDKFSCPNKIKHDSSEPAFDREKCPYCREVYVKKGDK